MAYIENLIGEILDESLRAKLLKEVSRLKNERQFGLVFEEHLPEVLAMESASVHKRALVARRGQPLNEIWKVISVDGDNAICKQDTEDGETTSFSIKDLVVIKRFGEPVFPTLVPVERIERSSDKPMHVLIEADNYHALQLLDYLYSQKVDLIYIDPPYNTGAKDWKYNNDYVDSADTYRHSKWLSFMKKRLLLAKRLLKPNGVLVIAIDNNELAHLVCLLETKGVFDEYELTIVTVVHNPRGNITTNFAKTNEYVVYLTPKSVRTLSRSLSDNDKPRKLRRWGHFSLRTERRSMFYPLYVKDGVIIRVGEQPSDDFHPTGRNVSVESEHGVIEIWPIDQDGEERRWNYGQAEISSHLDRIVALPKDGGLDLFLTSELSPPKTVWVAPELDAGGVYGSSLVESVVNTKFPYPKSLYTVLRTIEPVVLERPDALVIDFFAGSGTTMNALSLINSVHGGNRRSVLVTNNEVQPESRAMALIAKGYSRGTPEFESHGICQEITWPRCKGVVLGVSSEGKPLTDKYLTGQTTTIEKDRVVRPMEFANLEALSSSKKARKQLAVALGLTQKRAENLAYHWYIGDEPTAILFSKEYLDDFKTALMVDGQHIETIFIPFDENSTFKAAKTFLLSTLGKIEEYVPGTRLMSEGFEENIQYFRLDFLDKGNVETGRSLAPLLPTLWMMAGARGPLPKPPTKGEGWIAPKGCLFAILVDEKESRAFAKALSNRNDLEKVFIITNNQHLFFDIRSSMSKANGLAQEAFVQLYKDYLDNFHINAEQGNFR